MNDDRLWWLHMPPCSKCGKPHVLIDCTKRLAWEVIQPVRIRRRQAR